MTVRFTPGRGNDRVFGRIEGLEKLTRKGLRRGMFKAGQALISEASREILKGTKTGIVYIRRDRAGRRRRHLSSAPGETHANLSGMLRRSLSYQLHGATEIEFGYGVSSGKSAPDYAGWVEFGTTKMRARPSLGNALRSQQGNLTEHFERGILKELK
jgi:HK97 gp10 family phage protein